jgi:GNAT superfamily N-acetyltransferase
MAAPDVSSFRIVAAASPAQVADMIAYAHRESWNPGAGDAASFYAADPRGFFMGLVDGPDGAPRVATMVSAVAYPPASPDGGGGGGGGGYGFIGLYITDPAFRGRGLGLRTFRHAQGHLAALGCTVQGLDGVLAQVPNYKKSGFVSRYTHERYGFDTLPAAAGRAVTVAGGDGLAVAPLASVPRAELHALDAAWFGAARAPFLDALASAPGAVSFAVTAPSTDASTARRLAGYVVARPSAVGYRVGPLFARSDAAADALLAAVAAALPPGSHVAVDVPIDLPGRAAWLRALPGGVAACLGLPPAGESAVTPPASEFACVRMYASSASDGRGPPGMDEGVVYGSTTLELG